MTTLTFSDELEAKEGSFLLQLRMGTWDRNAFLNYLRVLNEESLRIGDSKTLDRESAHGVWFIHDSANEFLRNSSKTGKTLQGYYLAASELLLVLTTAYFSGYNAMPVEALKEKWIELRNYPPDPVGSVSISRPE